jgi:hypothetical protein
LDPGVPPLPEPEPEPQPQPEPEPSGKFQPGQQVYTTTVLNVRRSPGYVGKGEDDVIDEAPYGAQLTVVNGPQQADKLTWWQVRYSTAQGAVVQGWAAEANSQGSPYLSETPPPPSPVPGGDVPTKTFKAGDVVYNAYTEPVNVRRSPGFSGKPADDVVLALPGSVDVTIVAGPKSADSLTWWQIKGSYSGQVVDGWMAEVGTLGERFLLPVQLRGVVKLGKPFDGKWRVTQLFGQNPQYYKRYSYDGVPLRGHNGIDFGTPNDTNIRATDDGQVAQAGFDKGGFGYFVKLKHSWGESLYGHMRSLGVAEGDTVKRGDLLGPSDNTGGSTGPHLHFGIRVHPFKRGDGWGGCCDPGPFMNPDDLIIPDYIRGFQAFQEPPAMAEDAPGRVRP